MPVVPVQGNPETTAILSDLRARTKKRVGVVSNRDFVTGPVQRRVPFRLGLFENGVPVRKHKVCQHSHTSAFKPLGVLVATSASFKMALVPSSGARSPPRA